jgi:HlyD family secretion protein
VSALGVEEQRVNAIVDLDEPRTRWRTLGDGFRVETRITVWEGQEVLQVPAGAVFRHGDGWAVYAIEGGRARLRPVVIGRQNGAAVEIVRGIEPGGAVIVYPTDAVGDGTRVVAR